MYRVGVLGCRGIGVRHGKGVDCSDGAEIVAGCDLVEDLRQEFDGHFRETNPNLVLYDDFAEMLEKADLDILTIATGDDRHTDPVVAAAEAGVKGIFCEKPLAVSLEAADRMVEAVEKHGVKLSVDHTRHWMPPWRRCHDLVTEGAIGEVSTVLATHVGARSMLFRNGTHILDAIYWFAGAEPEWVFAKLEAGYEDYSEYRGDGGHVPDTEPSANAYIHFANGVNGNYIGEKRNPRGLRMEVLGSEGLLYIDNAGSAHLERDGENQAVDVPAWDVESIEAGLVELVDVLDGKGELSCTVHDGRTVVAMMMGILKSQQRGNVKVELGDA